RALPVRSVHASAEATSLHAGSLDLAVIADAIHFMDAELTALELSRVFTPRAGLAIITCELADTPFMHAIVEIMEEAAPRRPRDMGQAITQVFRATGVCREPERRYRDDTP